MSNLAELCETEQDIQKALIKAADLYAAVKVVEQRIKANFMPRAGEEESREAGCARRVCLEVDDASCNLRILLQSARIA